MNEQQEQDSSASHSDLSEPMLAAGMRPAASWVPAAGPLMRAQMPPRGLLQKASRIGRVAGRLARGTMKGLGKLTVATVVVGTAVGMVGNFWQTELAATGSIDVSKQAVAARAIDGSAMLPMTLATFNRYSEAQVLANMSYKSDWEPQLAAWKKEGSPPNALPDPRLKNTSFHPKTLGVYEKNVSAMRVVEVDYAGTRTLVVSFSGSDDFMDFARDSNGGGLLKKWITPNSSVQELQPGMNEAIELIKQEAGHYDRVVITGHSLGGYLANAFANQLSRSLGDDPQSAVLKKTQLLTVNSLYLGEAEPASLASIEHFREPLELTDIVGKPAFLRAPDPRHVVYVSGAPIADHALALQMEIDKLPKFPFGAMATVANGALFSVERVALIVERHGNDNEGKRISNYETGDGLQVTLPLPLDQAVTALGCSEPISDTQKAELQHDWFARSPQAGVAYNANPLLLTTLASETSGLSASLPQLGTMDTVSIQEVLASSPPKPSTAVGEAENEVATFVKALAGGAPRLNAARWKERQLQNDEDKKVKRQVVL